MALERDIPRLEFGVAKAQGALRGALEKADRIPGLLTIYEAEDQERARSNPNSDQMLPFDEEAVSLDMRNIVTHKFNLRRHIIARDVGLGSDAHSLTWTIGAGKSGAMASVPSEVRAETKKDMMLREVMELLSLRGTVHRTEILDHLASRGIDLGKSPLPSLAAFLSDHRALFESDGKGNFSLRPAGSLPPPDGANVEQEDELSQTAGDP